MPTEAQTETQLAVQLQAPVIWQPGATASGPEASAAAVRALATAVSLAERAPNVNEEATGLELEVARLHQKTHLLIELLALALARDVSRPATTELHLSGSECRWQSPAHNAPQGVGTLAIWLHPAAPEPMRWPAEITEAALGSPWVQARLLLLGEAAQAALDRYVFQLHRRAIAEARAARSEHR